MSVIELRVNMDCAGCENKIRKALMKVKGVDDVDIDMEMQKVSVMGWADQHKVLRAVRRTGRNVEMWPYPYNPESYNYYQRYYNNNNNNNNHQPIVAQTKPVTYYYAHGKTKSKKISYSHDNNNQQYNYNENNNHQYNYNDNYYHYNEDHYGYYQRPAYATVVDEQASSMFSDENPHACSIM